MVNFWKNLPKVDRELQPTYSAKRWGAKFSAEEHPREGQEELFPEVGDSRKEAGNLNNKGTKLRRNTWLMIFERLYTLLLLTTFHFFLYLSPN